MGIITKSLRNTTYINGIPTAEEIVSNIAAIVDPIQSSVSNLSIVINNSYSNISTTQITNFNEIITEIASNSITDLPYLVSASTNVNSLLLGGVYNILTGDTYVNGNFVASNMTILGTTTIMNSSVVNNSNIVINNHSITGNAFTVNQLNSPGFGVLADFNDIVYNSNIPILRISNGGYVGINTINTIYTFDVNGTSHFSSNAIFDKPIIGTITGDIFARQIIDLSGAVSNLSAANITGSIPTTQITGLGNAVLNLTSGASSNIYVSNSNLLNTYLTFSSVSNGLTKLYTDPSNLYYNAVGNILTLNGSLITSNINIYGTLKDSKASSGLGGYFLTSTGTGISWINQITSYNSSNIYLINQSSYYGNEGYNNGDFSIPYCTSSFNGAKFYNLGVASTSSFTYNNQTKTLKSAENEQFRLQNDCPQVYGFDIPATI